MSSTAFTPLETDRLLLRRFHGGDLRPFLAYVNDPVVARYQSWESYSEQRAVETIQRQESLTPGTPGQWFTFAREHQGRGMAFEAASRVLDYVFDDLGLHRVTAITDCENAQSVALLGRLGMRREGHFIQNIWFKGKWGSEYLYAILRDEWLKKRA